MKKLRLIAIAAIAAISSVAMTKAGIISSRDPQTWFFNGAAGQENDATKYQSDPVPGVECGGTGIICSIVDEPDASGDHPQLSQGTVSEDNTAYQPTERQ